MLYLTTKRVFEIFLGGNCPVAVLITCSFKLLKHIFSIITISGYVWYWQVRNSLTPNSEQWTLMSESKMFGSTNYASFHPLDSGVFENLTPSVLVV